MSGAAETRAFHNFMVVVGKHSQMFACCGLVVEIQPLNCYCLFIFAPLPTSTKIYEFTGGCRVAISF